MHIERVNSDALKVNQLPDGSRVIVDNERERVFALNATAGAAWDACSGSTTLSGVTKHMQQSLHPQITEELAEEAVLRLQEQNLVNTSLTQPSRRRFMTVLGAAVALPLVVSLPVAEQRAYAQKAKSKPTTTPPPPPKKGSGGGLLGLLGL